ncbi:hypothetical protein AX16_007929 [Volvariella volvacea WC 439]|nr:hypothetical protein AX16_007929 [Volvariella volvacea WC 439]
MTDRFDVESHHTHVDNSHTPVMSTKDHNHSYHEYPAPPPPPPQPRMANPGPAGLLSFAASTWLLSMYNMNAADVHTPNLILGMGVFCGGLLQFVAGLLEYPYGDLFSATAFSLYGAFWMSYSLIYIPGTGILAAYTDPHEFSNAMGLFLIVWMIVTIVFWFTVIKRHLALSVLLTCLVMSLMTLAIGEFTGRAVFDKVGGAFGMVVGVIAFYLALSELLKPDEHAIFHLPQGERTHW